MPYAAVAIMKISRGYGWKYILTQKATRQKALAESYALIASGGGAETVGGISKEAGEKEPHEFQWITNIGLTKKNLEEMIEAGRGDGK